MSNVVVEVFNNEHKWWERHSNCSLDSLMSMLFDLSFSYDIVDIDAYGFGKDKYLFLSLKKCVGYSSNIDLEMMDAISRIEFEEEG